MNFDYLVSVKANNIVAGERERLDFVARAAFTGNEDDYILVYDEISDNESYRTSIHVENGKIVNLRREGEMATVITLERGVRHMSEIVTPYGVLSLGIKADLIISRIEDARGELAFKYITYADREPLGYMRFLIKFYKKGTKPNFKVSMKG